MCPPASPSDISCVWSDEEIFMHLDKLEGGSPAPSNVFTDINPFQYMPANLPVGSWYLVHSEEKKDNELGFWKAREEAREIFTNHPSITGWRTTLEFFEGQAPHGRRTGWLMQQYKINKKGIYDKSKPKGSRLLCRVFLTDGVPNREMQTKCGNAATAGRQQFNSMPAENSKADSIGHGSTSNPQMKNSDEKMGRMAVIERCMESSVHILPEDYISGGDYLELNDLLDPETPSSSSDNSSRVSMTSEDYFELRDLEDENDQDLDLQKKSFKLSVSATAKPNEVVMRPATSGSLIEDKGHVLPAERTLPKPAAGGKFLDKKVVKHALGRMVDNRNEGASDIHNVAGSSSGCKPVAGKKRASVGRMRKLQKYLCFMPF